MRRFALLGSTLRTAWLLSTLAIPGIPGVSANAQTQPAIFPIPTQVPLPNGATPLFIADFNGDGIPDLAYNSSPSGTIGILLDFAGSSPTNVNTTICSGAFFADVNNDKKLDAISSCNGYITVQLGNGDATFQAPAYYAFNGGASALVDLNGDGYLDIAAVQIGTGVRPVAVAVLLNKGSTGPGVFGSPTEYAFPPPASGLDLGNFEGLFAGDFNGDGKQDLLTAFSYQGTATSPTLYPTSSGIDVFFGNGDGTLRQATVQPGPAITSLTVGDFNGDGVTDVAESLTSPTSNSLYGSVQILLGATGGTFTQGASLPIVGTNGGYLSAVSLSDQGPLDLVVNMGTGILTIFQGDGKANFTFAGSYPVPPYTSPLFADLNGDGKQDLIAPGNVNTLVIFPGNGDGTFQAPPAAPFSGLTADVNNDGIADILFFPQQNPEAAQGNFFATALGRGDGTYSILDQTTTLPSANYYLLVTGDFNGDGKIDTLAIQPGSGGPNATCGPPNAQLFSYLGTGNGQFVAKGTALALGVGSVQSGGITGDFNSDGKLDLILPYGCYTNNILFVPGNGDGTFGAPVLLNSTQTAQYPGLLAGDLNNDKKLDFIYGNAVFLGNGDGTFKQIPLNPASPSAASVIALADLNGDGILDAVYGPGVSIYAGNGDGTFQTTPFYTVPLPCISGVCTAVASFAFGDVNGDGNPDLLLVEVSSGPSSSLVLYLGDGHGNFTQDPNYYFTAGAAYPTPVRLNNQAPPPASDNRLDLSSGSSGAAYTISLLNQTNPTPAKPAAISSTTVLQASPATAAPNASITLTASVFGTSPTGSVSFAANGNGLGTEAVTNGTATLQTSFANAGSYAVTATYSGDSNNTVSTSAATAVTISPAVSATTLQAPSGGNVNGQITLKATVSGDSPTGSVSFAAGSTSLGTATLTSGVATLQTSFAAAGSYSVTATYKGDQNNAASTSSAATIVIAAPDFTISATPASGTITPGQTATYTFTVSPVGGYAGAVSFSCGTLPAQAACSFSPASVTPSGGSPASTTMTITTATSSAMLNPERRSSPSLPPWFPAGGLAMAGVIGLAFAPKRIWRLNQQLRWLCWALLLASLSLLASGCGGGGNNSPSNPGTPAGSYTVSVTASSSAGSPQHAMSITLIVQ
jgi:Bacterial Ig-like domain (group 3)/FG-GAP-like repeat